jgi:hypothetical protein
MGELVGDALATQSLRYVRMEDRDASGSKPILENGDLLTSGHLELMRCFVMEDSHLGGFGFHGRTGGSGSGRRALLDERFGNETRSFGPTDFD